MSSVKCSTGVRRRHTATPGVDPALLQAEISFWQDLIELRDATTSDECLERMKQALALAQSKLNSRLIQKLPSRSASKSPADNVFSIKHEDR